MRERKGQIEEQEDRKGGRKAYELYEANVRRAAELLVDNEDHKGATRVE